MRTRVFGATGRAVPLVGQGSWNLEQDDRREAVRALRRGIELGMCHLDTAEMYGSGRVEEILAEVVAPVRERLFLVSKVLPSNASRRGTVLACERSLARLRTDRLDCYLLHWPGSHPLAETIAAFEQLVAQGKILSYGVSNFDEGELGEAVRLAGPGRIACNQVLHHLEERAIEHAVVPACEQAAVAVVGYSPFGSDVGRFPSSPVLEDIGRAHGVSARAVALAFLAAQSEAMFLIPKAGKLAHVEDNARAGDLVLAPEELARIDAAFPRAARRRGVPML